MTDDPDAVWRRPSNRDDASATMGFPSATEVISSSKNTIKSKSATFSYTGPPVATPSTGPVGVPTLPVAPPQPPPQDHAAIDLAEKRAQAVTMVVTAIAGAFAIVLLVVMAIRTIAA